MAAVQGFCGLAIEGGRAVARPRLPESWKRVSFSASVKGRVFSIVVDRNGASIAEL
jgi:trehalose/maltose hydrolase-like predicted phosphorylase